MDETITEIDTVADGVSPYSTNAGNFIRTFWRWSSDEPGTIEVWFRISGRDVREHMDLAHFVQWVGQQDAVDAPDRLSIAIGGWEIVVPRAYLAMMPLQIRGVLRQVVDGQ